MNVAGQSSRIKTRNLDDGGSIFRSGSKGLGKKGLFASAGFMDLLVPARMEIDQRKGTSGDIFSSNIGPQGSCGDGISRMNTLKNTGKDPVGEVLSDDSAGSSLEGLFDEVDRSLVAGAEPSELLASLLHDDMNMSGGIVSSETPGYRVSEVDSRSNQKLNSTNQRSDRNDSGKTGDRGMDHVRGIAGRGLGSFQTGPQEDIAATAETMVVPGSAGTLEMKHKDIELDVRPENIRGNVETQRSGSDSGNTYMDVDALEGKSIEKLNPGVPVPFSGQVVREMEDYRLKAERESAPKVHSSSGNEKIQDQIPGLAEAEGQDGLMPESGWTIKDEFLEMAGRSAPDEVLPSRAGSREIADENVAVIHPAEATKSADKVKRINSTQRLQVLDSARQGLMEQIGNVVSRNGAQEIKMILSPPELGEMKIRVEVRGKRIRATFLVESVAVKGAVDSGAGSLAEAVINEGFVLENLDVSVNDSDKQTGWNMSDDDIPVEGSGSGKPENTIRPAEMVRNDSGGIDLLV